MAYFHDNKLSDKKECLLDTFILYINNTGLFTCYELMYRIYISVTICPHGSVVTESTGGHPAPGGSLLIEYEHLFNINLI